MEEYLLVFERENGALGVIRVSGTFEQVSYFIGEEMAQDSSIRCYITKVIKVVEVEIESKKEDAEAKDQED